MYAEIETVISSYWSHRFINNMVDTLSKKVNSDLYITTPSAHESRRVALKSVVGVLSGNFKSGDTVKIQAWGNNLDLIDNDLKLTLELLSSDLN